MSSNTATVVQQRERVLTALYKSVFPAVARYVSKRGGSLAQAQDVFHDALIAWYERAETSKTVITHSDEAYLFGIARHIWYRQYGEGAPTEPLNAHNDAYADDTREEQPSTGRLMALLERSGKKCLDMLKAFYYDKLSMTELAEGFGFRSVHSATVQKYKCLEKVRETVKEKSLQYADFLE